MSYIPSFFSTDSQIIPNLTKLNPNFFIIEISSFDKEKYGSNLSVFGMYGGSLYTMFTP